MGCFANVAEINLLHHFEVFEIAAPSLPKRPGIVCSRLVYGDLTPAFI